MEFKDLIIPTINVNDTKVTISDIRKENLEYIEEGEVLYCVETSKATEEYKVDFSGYVVLYINDMDEVEVGKSAGMIFKDFEDAKAKNEEIITQKTKAKRERSINASKKALKYAEEKGVDISLIKKDGIIKTQDIDDYLNNHRGFDNKSQSRKYNDNDLLIVGGGGLALMLIDAIKSVNNYHIIGILDDYAEKSSIVYGYEILGKIDEKLPYYFNEGVRIAVNAVGGMADDFKSPLFDARTKMADKIRSYGYIIPNIIHKNSMIEHSAQMGGGNIVLAGANIGSNVIIDSDTYINTNTVISHECVIRRGVRFAPGAVLAGRVTVGENTIVGMCSTIYMNLKIGSNCIIYNGINVFKNIADNRIVKE